MQKVAVTGATGHMGNVLVRQLLENNIKVRALILPGDSRAPLTGLDLEIVEADVTKPETLKGAFQNCDTVFHAAGLIKLGEGFLEQMRAVNVSGTRHVLEAARIQRVKRLVYTSSIHAFEDVGKGVIDENVRIDPDMTFSDYSQTKAEGTLLVRQAATLGMDTVILYPVGICGPFDFQRSELTRFIIDFRKGRRHIIPTGGYFFIDVRDVARLHIAAASKASRGAEYIISHSYQTTRQLVSYAQIPGHQRRIIVVPAGLAVWVGKVAGFFGMKNEGRFVLGEHAAHELRQRYTVSSAKADRELGKAEIVISQSFADAASWLGSQGAFN